MRMRGGSRPPKQGIPLPIPKLGPASVKLDQLRRAAAECHACPLWERATQTVFGEGPPHAVLMLVGEIPGDREDRDGRPFVGPAGLLLDRALAAAQVPRADVYITNAVKHFKWEPRGRRRIHKKPNAREIAACHQWLEGEIAVVAPRLIVALGATAAQALLGREFRLTQARGEVQPSAWGIPVIATVHPAAILRVPEREARQREREAFFTDIGKAARHARGRAASGRAFSGRPAS